MKLIDHQDYYTGLAIPVQALRSDKSCGCGEFADLAELGKWCQKTGLKIIQILPVNDTGTDPSPYSALSAFALHPIYIRLGDIPEVAENREFMAEVADFAAVQESSDRVDYRKVLQFKLSFLFKVYSHNEAGDGSIRKNKELEQWLKQNPWARVYAVFNLLKKKYNMAGWFSWPEYREPAAADIDQLFDNNAQTAYFFIWLQYLLEQQLLKARKCLEKQGISLKGDLPILMNEDSCDIWYERQYFRLDARAGAPPDMFSDLGQNWGFPVYNWPALEKSNFDWWRKRLAQASKFYQVFRIDHVLGFFRIWQIPAAEASGVMGHFSPFKNLKKSDLVKLGFDEARLNWLSQPHLPGEDLRKVAGEEFDRLCSLYLEKLGNENIYLFRPETSEKTIIDHNEPEHIKNFLLYWYRNRVLIRLSEKEYFPAWYLENSTIYQQLHDIEKEILRQAVREAYEKSELIWAENGRHLLEMVKNSSDMLVCAEDLGVIPDCVPTVLQELGILGLRIERWSRDYKKPGSPYIEPQDLPYLSVTTPSVHDTSTLRGWWEEDRKTILEYARLLGVEEPVPYQLTEPIHEKILQRNLASASAIVIFQLQDLLSLEETLRQMHPSAERVNTPGSVSEFNWSYRMPLTLGDLLRNSGLQLRIKKLLSARRQA